MSFRNIACIAAALTLGVATVSTDAMAFRGGHRGGGVAHRGGAYHGGVAYRGGPYRGRGGYYRGGRWYPGVAAGVAAGAAVLGAAAAAGSYYNAQCGYYPYPPCQ